MKKRKPIEIGSRVFTDMHKGMAFNRLYGTVVRHRVNLPYTWCVLLDDVKTLDKDMCSREVWFSEDELRVQSPK